MFYYELNLSLFENEHMQLLLLSQLLSAKRFLLSQASVLSLTRLAREIEQQTTPRSLLRTLVPFSDFDHGVRYRAGSRYNLGNYHFLTMNEREKIL